MKGRIFTFLICILLTVLVVYKLDDIVSFTASLFNETPEVAVAKKNTYSRTQNYEFVQITDDFVPYNYQDLLNIFYTVLDAGYDTFTFYCPNEYLDCISDVEKISDSENVDVLTTLGNFVAPFNNFTTLRVLYDTAGEVTIEVTHLYTDEDISNINAKIDELWNELVTDEMEKEDIIYAFHDYIINTTRYDEAYATTPNDDETPHNSSKANGPLFDGYAICSGYTDAMAIVLDRLDIPNFKVASDTHVWNALYLDNEWLHLDLTWDDPVSEDHSVDNLLHKFFLINTQTLEEFDISDHTFDKSIYLELK